MGKRNSGLATSRNDTGKRGRIFAALLAAALVAVTFGACISPGGDAARLKNAVRRAVVAYELQTRGPVDELMVYYSLTNDARDDLGFEYGNTVWLRDAYHAKDYIENRDYSLSYVIIQEIGFASDREAAVTVIRGDSGGYVTRQLTLEAREDGAWAVVADEEE